jgi:hypothetical protein
MGRAVKGPLSVAEGNRSSNGCGCCFDARDVRLALDGGHGGYMVRALAYSVSKVKTKMEKFHQKDTDFRLCLHDD